MAVKGKFKQSDVENYREEAVPFDDALRTLLKAKPQHRTAEKLKTKKNGKTKAKKA
jgi:hypothetical protein